MIEIQNFLNLARTRAHISGISKKRVVENIAELFCQENEALESDDIFQQIIARERLGSTAIGNGVAIPHCRYNKLEQTLGVCITLDKPIDFDSIDGQPVDILFAIMVPQNAEDKHLQILAAIAEKFQYSAFLEKIRHCNNDETLFATLIE